MLAHFQKPTDGESDVEYKVSSDGKINAVRKTSSSDERRIRNAETDRRTSTMPGAPRNDDFSGRKRDIATEFNKSYENAGIQPTPIEDRPNPAKQKKEQGTTFGITSRQKKEGKRKKEKKKPFRRLRKVLKLKRAVRKKARVTAVNIWLWAWGGWFWFWFQLPFAIFSLVFMAITQVVYSYFNSTAQLSTTDPTLWQQMKNAIGTALTDAAALLLMGANWVSNQFGFDLYALQPANFFLLTHTIVFFLGIGTLILCYIQYKIAFMNPLGGKKGTMKMAALLMALIGYSVPILNLFPWFYIWTFVVWFYPE